MIEQLDHENDKTKTIFSSNILSRVRLMKYGFTGEYETKRLYRCATLNTVIVVFEIAL